MAPLSRFVRLHVWLRLLLLQGSWNFERHQGLGFFYALLPALKKIYRDEQELLQAGREHVRYFNTHPYLAPAVAGAVLRLEEERAAQRPLQVSVAEFKEMVAAPYAAIGDALFWGGLRPLAAGVSLLFAVKGLLWAPLVYLLVYNLVPFGFRVLGYIRGYREGLSSVEFMQRHHLPDWAIHTKEAAVVVLGGFSAFSVFQYLQQGQLASWLGLLALPPIILVGLLARKGVSTLLLALLTSIVILLACLFWTDLTDWLAL